MEESGMRHDTTVLITGLALSLAAPLRAQTTGMPSFNAPYRAFQRSEFGAVVSFPDGSGTAFEGEYRYARGRFDIGLRAGMFDPGSGAKTRLLVGGEVRERVVTHNADFPLDGALVAGIGTAIVSGGSALFIPVGISLGRRVDPHRSSISIVPYVQPTGILVSGSGTTDLNFTLGLGADFRLTHTIDARFSAGIGDLHGVSLAAMWVH
jgi:hypothetical protein